MMMMIIMIMARMIRMVMMMKIYLHHGETLAEADADVCPTERQHCAG